MKNILILFAILLAGNYCVGQAGNKAIYPVLPESCPPWDGTFMIRKHRTIFPALCDSTIAGPGWMVIARRLDGNLNFYRNWAAYKNGFGELSDEFFIGMEKLAAITAQKPHELYIHFEDFSGGFAHAHYKNFSIADEREHFRLNSVGTYSGTAGDALTYHTNKRFFTFDAQCKSSVTHMGAWWYATAKKPYMISNLFGMYVHNTNEVTDKINKKIGMVWTTSTGETFSHKSMWMLIRPRPDINEYDGFR